MRQVIEVRLEDKPGALMRVVGILTAKGSNIESLVLTPDRLYEGTSKMTIAADVEPRLCRRVVQEMNRLVNVFVAHDVTPVTGATCSPDIP
jgi:acetolactate synthase-1/3 small subunit